MQMHVYKYFITNIYIYIYRHYTFALIGFPIYVIKALLKKVLKRLLFFFFLIKMIEGSQEMWSTIPLKDFHMFKIVEL